MKVKYKLGESSHYKYIIEVNNIHFAVNLLDRKLCLYGIRDKNVPLSKIESAFAVIRGFFAHKENMDKLLELDNSENKFYDLYTPTSIFYGRYMEGIRRCNGVQ